MRRVVEIALLGMFCSCSSIKQIDIESAWHDCCNSRACMPDGNMWSEHEVGQVEYKKMYSAILVFQSLPKEHTIPLLLDRLSSTAETSIHICPFANATENELAVYMLQSITGRPWFKAIDLSDRPDNPQKAVAFALSTTDGRIALYEYFKIKDSDTVNFSASD